MAPTKDGEHSLQFLTSQRGLIIVFESGAAFILKHWHQNKGLTNWNLHEYALLLHDGFMFSGIIHCNFILV